MRINSGWWQNLGYRLRPYKVRWLEWMAPSRCLCCHTATYSDRGTVLCPPCWNQLVFLGSPCCRSCGWPFGLESSDTAFLEALDDCLCPSCLRSPPRYHSGRAVLQYNRMAAVLVHQLKLYDRTSLATLAGQWMAWAGKAWWPHVDYLVPVPMPRWRLWKRRYNQAGLLAQAVHRITGVPLYSWPIKRLPSRTQRGLTRRQRRLNLRGRLVLTPQDAERLRGKNVVVIDDVWTTGATLDAMTRALDELGVHRIHVLVLARVLLPS
jgi:ComF family protein